MGVMAGAATAGAAAATNGERAWPARGAGAALRRALGGLACRAPVRVFVLQGLDSPAGLDALRLRDDVLVLDSPRSAMVLLVAGQLPPSVHEAAQRVHDALAHPRATVWWTGTASIGPSPFSDAMVVVPGEGDSSGQLASVLVQVHRDLLLGTRVSEPARLVDEDPAPWRGVGPFGQGGAGMTGGVPYGRPMTGRAADRDGLELDQLPIRVGPFFPSFPPGLVLDVRLQGDVVQDVVVPGNVFAGSTAAWDDGAVPSLDTPPIPVATLERSRARHHLRWLAHALRVQGLEALGRRALALAATLEPGLPSGARAEVLALARLLERTRALGWATAEVGVTAAELVADRGLGPVARAAGLAEDARMADPAYVALGFEPVVARGGQLGDARARWRQRVAEAAHSLDLAARAGDRQGGADGLAMEGPRGRVRPEGTDAGGPSGVCLALLPALLLDQDWADAVTTIVSLDIDVREAAGGASPLAPPAPPKISGGMGGKSMAGMAGMAGMGGMPAMEGNKMTGSGGESPPRADGPETT